MRSNVKKFILYSTTLCMIFMGGAKIKSCRDKAEEFSDQIVHYTDSFQDDSFSIVAHRGYSSKEFENTTDAIALAGESPYVDYIEVDARLTRDGEIVLSHTDDLLSTHLIPYDIEEESLSDLQKKKFLPTTENQLLHFKNSIQNGYSFFYLDRLLQTLHSYSLPTLEEGMESCGNKKILLDLKFDGNVDSFLSALKEKLGTSFSQAIILQSANLDALEKLREVLPEYSYAAIVSSKDQLSKASSFDMITLRKNLVTADTLKELFGQNKKVAVWTLNHPEEIMQVLQQAGDYYDDLYYITDFPDVVSYCLEKTYSKKKK